MRTGLSTLIFLFFGPLQADQVRTVEVGCGGVLYRPDCDPRQTEPECHWLLGGGTIEHIPLRLKTSEYGNTWEASVTEQNGTWKITKRFSVFEPIGGFAQYTASLDVTTDGKSHAFSQSEQPPGTARLFSAVINPDRSGGGVWCSIRSLDKAPQNP